MKFILASASPRRKEILKNNGYEFDIVPSLFDEKINGLKYSDELVINCAYQKALDVKDRFGDDCAIISADTVVVHNNIILGKPKDFTEAKNMLLELSNDTHFVATAVCILYKNKVLNDIEKTFVTFKKLSNEEIINYINSKNPLDKAGSYGIQDEGFDFAQKIDGNIDNVIGFPIILFKNMLDLIRI